MQGGAAVHRCEAARHTRGLLFLLSVLMESRATAIRQLIYRTGWDSCISECMRAYVRTCVRAYMHVCMHSRIINYVSYSNYCVYTIESG